MRRSHGPIGESAVAVLAHLRLPIQLTLAPLFLWGAFGTQMQVGWPFLRAFVAMHLFLYGGATLYNSSYDCDKGPIAGLERPPALPVWSAPFSLCWQFVGLCLIATVDAYATAFYLAFMIVGVMYTHPSTRLKARPFVSAGIVTVFQGFGGFAAGWVSVSRESAPAQPIVFCLFAVTAAATTLGFYPLTQVFQVDEDSQRGDRTLAVVLGTDNSFRLSLGCFLVAGCAGAASLVRLGHPGAALFLALGFVGLVAACESTRRQFIARSLQENFHAIMRIQYIATMGLAGFVLVNYVVERFPT